MFTSSLCEYRGGDKALYLVVHHFTTLMVHLQFSSCSDMPRRRYAPGTCLHT